MILATRRPRRVYSSGFTFPEIGWLSVKQYLITAAIAFAVMVIVNKVAALKNIVNG